MADVDSGESFEYEVIAAGAGGDLWKIVHRHGDAMPGNAAAGDQLARFGDPGGR